MDDKLELGKKWFREAKYGMFIHWGLYSLLAGEYKDERVDEQIGREVNGTNVRACSEWSQAHFRIPNAEYEKLAAAFNPIYFNADEYVKLCVDAGMKYMVFTSKHHDGFAMFKSSVDKYNVAEATPYKKDVVEQLANACARNNFKFGIYYSQALDWHEKDGGGYEEIYGDNYGVSSYCNDWDFPDASQKNYTRCFEKKIKPQVKELLTNYGDIAVMWFDVPWSINNTQADELYKMVRKYQPYCLVNSRICCDVDNRPEYRLKEDQYDFRSWGDNVIPEEYQSKGKLFETPATLNDTWGYSAHDQNWKSAEKVKELREHLNERGINYLLNVGPDYLGRIPVPSKRILLAAKP